MRRKFATYGAAALLVLSSAVGVSYAQDATATVTPTITQTTTAQTAAQTTWLGVTVSDDNTGVTVTRVSPNSPAETAKLQVGDVILSVNGTTVETAADLQKIIQADAAGDVVTLAVQRGTDQVSVSVTLASRPVRGMFALPSDPLQAASLVLHAQLTAADGGYQVASVSDRNPFQLAVGDVITEVNGTAIASVDWATLLAPPSTTTTTANTVTLTVTRAGAERSLEEQHGMFGGRGGQPGGFPGNGQPNGGQDHGQPGGSNGQPGGFPGNGNGQPNGGQPGNNGGAI